MPKHQNYNNRCCDPFAILSDKKGHKRVICSNLRSLPKNVLLESDKEFGFTEKTLVCTNCHSKLSQNGPLKISMNRSIEGNSKYRDREFVSPNSLVEKTVHCDIQDTGDSSTEKHSIDNLLHISWCDSRWVPVLNATNILDYFTERSNPFYSKECNNEFLKMQQNTRMDQLTHMQGVEYCLLHAQDPILYIVRKQHRYSPTQVNPLACYHIIAGQVFQTPDLGSVINSRLVSAVNNISSAFSELQSYAQYHPSKGYSWQTPKQGQDATETQKKTTEKKKPRKEMSSAFQRRRVDSLLNDLAMKFPFKPPPAPLPQASQAQASVPTSVPQSTAQSQPAPGPASGSDSGLKTEEMKSEPLKVEPKTEPKSEQPPTLPQSASQRSAKPPPEKRQKLS